MLSFRYISALGSAIALIVLSLCVSTTFATEVDSPAFVFYDSSLGVDALDEVVRDAGGKLVVVMPESDTAVVRGDQQSLDQLQAQRKILDVVRGSLERTTRRPLRDSEDPVVAVADAWELLTSSDPDLMPPASAGIDERDALVAPEWWHDEDALVGTNFSAQTGPDGRPFGATWMNTSEFLAGGVSVNLFLMESDGSLDPSTENWTSTQESRIFSEAIDSLISLQNMYPDSGLWFVLHLISGRVDSRARTQYEPITRPADPFGSVGEDAWVREILGKMGYAGGSRMSLSRMLADDTRIDDGTEWGVNIFVAHSRNDGDGRFADGRFGYAWLGGPHIVMTYDNANWGYSFFDWVMRHEMHHSFFALDQYTGSDCDCDDASGYLGAFNTNCQPECSDIEPCVMIDNSTAHSEATEKMVGTYDSDGDAIPDVLDVNPLLTIRSVSSDPNCTGVLALEGEGTVVPYPNRNPYAITPLVDITIHHVASVSYRIDDGIWVDAGNVADDGQFDSTYEEFEFDVSLPLGRHQVDVQVIDTWGNTSDIESRNLDVFDTAQPVTDSLQLEVDGAGVMLRWDAAVGATSYAVRKSSDPATVRSNSPVLTLGATNWQDTQPGKAFYLVSSIDACGDEVSP